MNTVRILTTRKYKKEPVMLKNTKTEMKNTLGVINRIGDTEECKSNLENRIMEITQSK